METDLNWWACRSKDRYYNTYLYPSDTENDEGIENTRGPEEYSEKIKAHVARSNSASSLQTVSLKELQGFVTPSPSEEVPPRKGTPVLQQRSKIRTNSGMLQGVPQTDV